MLRTPPLLRATLILGAALASLDAQAQTPAPAPGDPADAPPSAATPAAAAAPAPQTDAPTIDTKLSAAMGRSGGLTAAEVGQRASSTSREARAKDAEVAAAETELDRAVVAFFPRLTLVGRYTRLSDIDAPSFGGGFNLTGTMAPAGQPFVPSPTQPLIPFRFAFPIILDQYTLQASLAVPISDYLLRLSQSYTAASRSREAAKLQALAARATAGSDAKLAYYTWARAKLQVVLAEQALAQAGSHLKDVKVAFSVARASKADVMRAESQVAAAELLVERATNAATIMEDQLRTRMHDEAEGAYQLGEDLLAPLPPIAKQKPTELYAEAVRQRPEIRALEQTAYSLRQQSRSVSAGNWPRLDAAGNYTYANPNQRFQPASDKWNATWDVSLQLSWSPNDIGTAAPVAAGLNAKAEAIEAQRAALSDGLRLEVLAAYQAAREADVAVQTTQRGLAAAEEAYRVRRELFNAARATATEVMDAETALLQSRLEHVNAHVDARVARVKLAHALGRDVAAPRRGR